MVPAAPDGCPPGTPSRGAGSGDRVGPEVLAQSVRDADRAVRLQVRLEECGVSAGHAQPGAVECVNQLRPGVRGGPIAQVHAAGLKVGVVRAGADLEPPADPGGPGLEVVALGLGKADVGGAALDGPIRQLERLEDLLRVAGQPLELVVAVGGMDELDHLDLVELVDAEQAAGILAGRAGLAPEAGRVGGVVDRERVRRQDLVAVDVGDRHLRGRDQVKLVALDGVHLVLLVGELPGASSRGGVDQERRPQLGVAVVPGELEHEADERALQPGAGTGVQDESRAGELGPALEVEQVEPLGDLPVGRRRLRGARLAPAADDRVVLGPLPVGDRWMRQVGDEQQVPLDGRLELGELGVEGVDPRREARHPRLQRVARLALAGAHELAELLVALVALGADAVRLRLDRPTAGIRREDPVDRLGRLALAGDGLPDGLRVVADEGDADHVARVPAAAASRRRVATNARSSEASSQPARGPLGRARKAAYRAANAWPVGRPRSRAASKTAPCRTSPVHDADVASRSPRSARKLRCSAVRSVTASGKLSWTSTLARSGAYAASQARAARARSSRSARSASESGAPFSASALATRSVPGTWSRNAR